MLPRAPHSHKRHTHDITRACCACRHKGSKRGSVAAHMNTMAASLRTLPALIAAHMHAMIACSPTHYQHVHQFISCMPVQDACSTDTYIHGHRREYDALTFHRALSETQALLFRNPQLPPHQTPHPVTRFNSVMPMFRIV